MDCQTILQEEMHEKYLFNKLKEPEKTQYEKHFQECPSCHKELESQRRLIAGIREIGHLEMKNEIRRQVETQKSGSSEINWARLSRIAAVLFVFVMTPTLIYIFKTNIPKHGPVQAEFQEKILPAEETVVEAEENISRDRLDMMKKEAVRTQKPQTSKQRSPLPADRLTQPGEGRRKEDKKGETSATETRRQAPMNLVVLPEEDELNEGIASETFDVQSAQLPDKKATGSEEQTLRPPSLFFTRAFGDHSAGASVQRFILKKQKDFEGQLVEKARTAAGSELRFRSNEQVITVHLIVESRASTGDLEIQPPQSFPVKFVKQDSLDWQMNWFVDASFLQLDLSDLALQLTQAQELEVILKDRFVYRIDVQQDSTAAIRVR